MTGSLLVPRRQLRVGPLLAEGGEGKVYELLDHPEQLFKAYRDPRPSAALVELVGWAASLAEQVPALEPRVRASAAWPLAVVVEGSGGSVGGGSVGGSSVGGGSVGGGSVGGGSVGGGSVGGGEGKGGLQTAAGLLLPRAPRRFSLRHRDGRTHLASLSYLTADPDRRSAAYGIDLPPPMSPERLGLVYALARLLEGFESASPRVVHGDLSAKNVLWSLARGPEVFVIDCDSAARYRHEVALGPGDRRRAMTPNWDDPAIPPGSDPGPASDRYSLALIFLRVCGAAHYPIQKRQKAGETIRLEVGVPASNRRARSLAAGAPLWDLVARGLTATDVSSRPPAGAWVQALQVVIEDLGATRILDAVRAAQGGGSAAGGLPAPIGAGPVAAPATRGAGEVTVVPVAMTRAGPVAVPVAGALRRPASSTPGWTGVRGQPGPATLPAGSARLTGPAGRTVAPPPIASPPSGPSAAAQARRLLLTVLSWLVEEHRRTVRYLRTPDRRRRGLLRIPWCVGVDLATGAVVLFVAAMVASPFLGI